MIGSLTARTLPSAHAGAGTSKLMVKTKRICTLELPGQMAASEEGAWSEPLM